MPTKRTKPQPTADPAVADAASPAISPRRHRDIESFLRAIALGTEPATMAQRLRAAATLLRASATHASDIPPKERARRAAMEEERLSREDWQRRADEIRVRLKAKPQ